MPRTLWAVEFSVKVYRLLTWVYPPPFRCDYGEAMAHLFRDACLDGYRRGGWVGLFAVWAEALADLARSAASEHREAIVARRQQFVWLAGACSAASAALSAGLWWASFNDSVGLLGVGRGTSLRVTNGVIECRHVCGCQAGPPVPESAWHEAATIRGWVRPPDPGFPRFAFSSGHVLGLAALPGTVTPVEYWLWRVPLWVFLAPVLVWPVVVVRRRGTGWKYLGGAS